MISGSAHGRNLTRTLSFALGLIIWLAAAVSLPSSAEQVPTVRLPDGIVEGQAFAESSKGAAFLGIPYAAPPVGALRWKAPEPRKPWTGVLQANKFGPACPQLPAPWLPYIAWNEDCLSLNVWTPDLAPSAKLPVIVYFHGGGNTAGYSQFTVLGPALSPLGVVVVNANYRLGPFGFLAHPALTAESSHHASGNYGLLDQIASLKWVQKNISLFGGDPSRITVMGQSAGAYDICLLMASPLAAGLFQQGIMQSGECQSGFIEDIRTPIAYNSVSGTGESEGDRFVKGLGLTDSPNLLERLREMPADKILKAWSDDPQVHFDALVDGWAVPQQPATIFREGKQLRIPVIIGSNADEATVFGHPVNTIEEYKKFLRQDTGKYSETEFQLFPAAKDDEVPAQYLRFQSNSFAYGAYSLARAMARVDQKAYLYYFTYTPLGERAKLGAYHGEELNFLSNHFPNDWTHSANDETLGRQIRSYWIQFAKTGDPNDGEHPHWPSFHSESNQRFELGRHLGLQTVPPQIHGLDQLMTNIVTGKE
jgi:para-nitrobenzyl esterase